MARIVLTILATVAFVAFALSNTERVEVSFVIGEPIETRLIFLLVTSFACGALSASFYQMIQETKRRAELRKLRLEAKKAVLKEVSE